MAVVGQGSLGVTRTNTGADRWRERAAEPPAIHPPMSRRAPASVQPVPLAFPTIFAAPPLAAACAPLLYRISVCGLVFTTLSPPAAVMALAQDHGPPYDARPAL